MVRSKNIKDYALGGSNFSTGATCIYDNGHLHYRKHIFIILSKTYSDGLYYPIALSGFALFFLLLAILFIPRMTEFIEKTSIAEAMGELYGKEKSRLLPLSQEQ